MKHVSNAMYNSANKSDLHKQSSFFAKTRKKAANPLRQFLAALGASVNSSIRGNNG